jgi:hypothetical protein
MSYNISQDDKRHSTFWGQQSNPNQEKMNNYKPW